MISAHDQIRIAAHAVICQRTVRRVYAGQGSEYSKRRVTEAAVALGLPPPPSTSSEPCSSGSPPKSQAA